LRVKGTADSLADRSAAEANTVRPDEDRLKRLVRRSGIQ